MQLRSIRLNNVRRFIDPIEIADIGPGLNVLSAPNEHGKSTVFDALQAVFFKDCKSWDREVRALAPHAGGDPEVAVEFETEDGVFRVEKRWSKSRKGDARIYTKDRLLKQADEAEAWLSDVVKAPRDGGPAGLLWVRQGMTSLDDGDSGRTTRRDLLSSVAGEIELMTGGRRMDGARDRCRKELDRYVTKRGSAKIGGPLKQATEEVARLEAEKLDLASKVVALRSDLDNRRQLRRELASIEDADEDAARRARLKEAQNAFDDASSHAEGLKRAVEKEESARLEKERAEKDLASLKSARAEAADATSALEAAKSEAVAASERHNSAEAELASATKAHDDATRRADKTAEIHGKVLRVAASTAAVKRRGELVKRLADAETIRTEIEQAEADTKTGLATASLRKLEGLSDEVRILRKTREAEATAITMHYTGGRNGGVALDGSALPDGERIPIPNGATLDIGKVGRLAIHPGRGVDGSDLSGAETTLSEALKEAGYEDIEAARAANRGRVDAETRQRDAMSRLKVVAPDGIEELRKEISGLPEPVEADDDLPTVEQAQENETAAKKVLAGALKALELARHTAASVRSAAARAEATAESAAGRLDRSEAALAAFKDPEAEEARLEEQLGELQASLDEAVQHRAETESAAPDLKHAEAWLERARSALSRAEEDRQRISLELVRLDTAIEMQAADAVEEELADVESRLEADERRLAQIEFEVAVLQKLDKTLEAARTAARDRYVEPVLTELTPLIRLLWPDARLRFDSERVVPAALIRSDTEEDFDVLSGGTQEQIALLVRLAFARLLAKSGRPAPVVLDDAIVFTDDDRIERMFDALTRQAQDLQILVFSCRQKAFRDLGGQGLTIAAKTLTVVEG